GLARLCARGHKRHRKTSEAGGHFLGRISLTHKSMRFSEFLQYRPKPADNIFIFACPDEFLVEESRAVWTRMFEGTWVIEKVGVKEFEDIDEYRLSAEARTP